MKVEEVVSLDDLYKASKSEVVKRAWKTRKFGGSNREEIDKTLVDHLKRAAAELKEEFGEFIAEPSHGGKAALLVFKDGARALAYMSGSTKADRLLVDTEWRGTYKPSPPITLGGKVVL